MKHFVINDIGARRRLMKASEIYYSSVYESFRERKELHNNEQSLIKYEEELIYQTTRRKKYKLIASTRIEKE
ncbi:hypothetical protein [Carboxylicivirga caseinilyticus]|uniref:hypothetical protein n=1 Tax=Carboxylicivirga caseinilyticus TaxID=3417572 RepID=UPI003D33B8CC|nr:hypothetical protein [Marinilabiliaceae bacterium A049]